MLPRAGSFIHLKRKFYYILLGRSFKEIEMLFPFSK